MEKSDDDKLRHLIDEYFSEEELNKLYHDLLLVQQHRYMGKWPSILYKLWKGGREA